jgi:hypothetical protein
MLPVAPILKAIQRECNSPKKLRFMLKNFFTLTLLSGIFFYHAIYPEAKDTSDVEQKMRLINTAALSKNPYFHSHENITYALIYYKDKDSLFFVSKKTSLDSTKYVLVFISNNRISAYQFIKFKKPDGDTLIATGEINLPENKIFFYSLYYLPVNSFIRSVVYKQGRYNQLDSKPVMHDSSRFEFGLRYEFIYVATSVYNSNDNRQENTSIFDAFPPNLDIFMGFSILNRYKFNFRFGIAYLIENDLAFDGGIFIKSRLLNTNIYASVGFSFMGIGVGAHGVTDYQNYVAYVPFLCPGVGYEVSQQFNIDLSYYFPFNKVYGSDIVSSYPVTHKYNKKINTFINLGFQYSIFY